MTIRLIVALCAAASMAAAPLSRQPTQPPEPTKPAQPDVEPDPKPKAKKPASRSGKPAARSGRGATELMNDLMKSDTTGDNLIMIGWMPTEFFESVSRERGSSFSAALRKSLDSCTIVWVIDGTGDPMSGFDFKTREQLESSVKVIDSKGRRISTLSRDDVTPGAPALAGAFEPMLASMLGKLGEGSVILFFPSHDQDGAPLADPLSPGQFRIEIGKKSFRYRLPIDSLVPQKECPKCHELLSGAFNFCPYDGEKLSAPKEAEKQQKMDADSNGVDQKHEKP